MADEAEATSPAAPAAAKTNARAPDSPGQRLQRERQARKLDVSYVATTLRLTPQVVDAIERDDYRQLPNAVFVSGYIRSYARLMGLDPEPLNQRFHELHPNAEAPPRHVARAESTLSEPAEGGHLLGYLFAILLVIAVAGGAYAWWITRSAPGPITDAGTSPELTTGLGAGAEVDSPGPSAGEPIAPAAPAPREPAPTEPAPAIDQALDSDSSLAPEPVVRASADVAVIERDDAQQRAREDTPIADSSAEANPSERSQPLPRPNSPEVEPPPARTAEPAASDADADRAAAESGAPPVDLAFSGPCWVDIRDSTGEVLLFGEMSQGDRKTLEGTPPYSLVIGNAAAVELSIGGEPFDLKSVARGNVARFDLDPAEISAQSANATD